MTNVARGEYPHKIDGKIYNFALTLKASAMLEKMSTDGRARPPFDEMTAILSAMTEGTMKPVTAEQVADMPITLAEFRTIIKGATDAANAAMPEGRSVAGNGQANRKARRAKKK